MAKPDWIKDKDWTSWIWQMKNRIHDADGLEPFIKVSDAEREAISRLAGRFRFQITPYFASLMDPEDPGCPIRRQVIPSIEELHDPEGLEDPLEEEAHSPVRGIISVYPDKVAFCVSNECALYCRFCLRKRMVGDEIWAIKRRELEEGIKWLRAHSEVRDVLLTGGDPLSLSDEKLEWLISSIRAIPHIKIIRIGTRYPATLPFRITKELCMMLEKYHPIWVNTHFNHPKELTVEAASAADLLLRAGIPLGNQSVLLKGINDDLRTMKDLCEGLIAMRVRPYYCYQAQMLSGTSHFRTPIEKGMEMFRNIYGRTSGFAIPRYILDTPAGKVPLDYPYLKGREGDYMVMETFEGRTWRELNPKEEGE